MIQSGKKSFKGRGENPGILNSIVPRMQPFLFTEYTDGTAVNVVGWELPFNGRPLPLWSSQSWSYEELVPDMESRSEVQSVTVRKSVDKWKVPSESPFVLAYLGSHPLVFPISDPADQ